MWTCEYLAEVIFTKSRLRATTLRCACSGRSSAKNPSETGLTRSTWLPRHGVTSKYQSPSAPMLTSAAATAWRRRLGGTMA